uniref:Sodium/hydrogen exchanger 11-like n=1 Tax=Pogona vitticeps TaxID=103695 RepID=A0A6J0SXR7_9SAUR
MADFNVGAAATHFIPGVSPVPGSAAVAADLSGSKYNGDKDVRDFHILRRNQPVILLVIVASFAVGALLRTILKRKKIPILVIVFFIGVIIGTSQLPFVKTIAEIDPVLFLHLFSPVIIFTAAFEMDFYIFQKSFWQVLILAVLGFVMNCASLGWLTYKTNQHKWTRDDNIIFGIILCTTDPDLSVASIKNIGISKILINLIKGESLFNGATTTIVFELYRDLVNHSYQKIVQEIFVKLTLKIFGSAVFGFVSSKMVIFWLANIFNDRITEVILSFSMTYLVFYLAEWLGMSGIIAVCVLGLLMDSVSFSPGMDVVLSKFWSMLTFLAQIMIYLTMGIVIAQKTFPYMNFHSIFYIVTIYLSLNLIRALVTFILSPLLNRFGYGFNWRWGAVIVWSGVRGLFTLNMALEVSQTPNENSAELEIKNMILLYSVAVSLLTLVINSTTVEKLVMTLGLCNVSLPKRVALHNAFQRIKQMEANNFTMLKLDKFLADANWALAEKCISVEDPKEIDSVVKQLMKTFRCPNCNVNTPLENSQQMADIMEEARLRLLTAQIASYQKQYNSGMLSQKATQTLIGAAECYFDVPGKFMNIHEVKKYWEDKGLLMSMKKYLSDWAYNVKPETSRTSENRFLKLCQLIVYNDTFEHTSSLITYLNFIPILLRLIPTVNMEFLPQLKICNYYFLSLYIMEAMLKIIAMGRSYIRYHWNKFDLLVIIVGIVDVMVINIIRADDRPYAVVSTVRVFRFIRVLRLLRLLKHVVPKIIAILERQINKQRSFCYDIAKGYIQAEEDIKCLIEQIAGHEKVCIEINKILEKNKQDALKELGLMQRDYPDIVTAVKTKQAVQTVINTDFQALQYMISGCIVDKNEGAELYKIILLKRKKLATLPPTIAPPTAPELLRNVMWLCDNEHQLEYIQEKAKKICFDYGDVVSKEGDLPQGIHLIVSGMVKLSGSTPRYGVYNKEIEKHLAATPYTDYLGTGTIIGEVNCLTKQEMEYTVTCETAVQTCFISANDLLEAFDTFLETPSLEDKIWRKIALDIALKTLKEALPNQDWAYKICAQFSNVQVVDIPNHTKHDIYDATMDDVILVHGAVQDCQLGQCYYAPCILPKTCHQVRGNATVTKLLVIQATNRGAQTSSEGCNPLCQYHSSRRREALGNVFSAHSTSPGSVTTDPNNLIAQKDKKKKDSSVCKV